MNSIRTRGASARPSEGLVSVSGMVANFEVVTPSGVADGNACADGGTVFLSRPSPAAGSQPCFPSLNQTRTKGSAAAWSGPASSTRIPAAGSPRRT